MFTLSTPTKPNASLHLSMSNAFNGWCFLVNIADLSRYDTLAFSFSTPPELSPACFPHYLWKLRGIHTTTMMPVAIHMKVCGGPTLCRRQLRRLMLFKETT